MKDKDFLLWLADRLVHIYQVNPNTDYVGKLVSIANALPADQVTPNTESWKERDKKP